MKRMQYIWSVLLACVLVSCEEKLPEFDVTTLSMKAEWRDANLHLTADVDKSSGAGIVERGFVVELPRFEYGYWDDRGGLRDKRTLLAPIEGDFAYTVVSEGWDAGLKGTVYAYVKTPVGSFRSKVIEFETEAPKDMEFTSVAHLPSDRGPYFGGQVIIEGKDFNALQSYVTVRVNHKRLKVESVEPQRIVASYREGDFTSVGEYTVEVTNATRSYTLEQKMVVEGIRIVSMEPERPRHGDVVKMYLENYTPFSLKQICFEQMVGEVELLEDKADYISFRIPETYHTQFDIMLRDNRNILTQPFTVEVEPSWRAMDLAQAGWQAERLEPWGITFHQGKSYFCNEGLSTLMVFDSATRRFKQVAMPDVPHSEWKLNHLKLVGWKDHLYMFVTIFRPWDVEQSFMCWQYIYRMDLQTEQWLLLAERENSEQMLDEITMANTDDGVVYVAETVYYPQSYKLSEYHLETGEWKESGQNIPEFAKILGSDGTHVYYHLRGDGGLYGVDSASGGQPKQVFPQLYPREFLSISEGYIYYTNGLSIYRKRLDASDAKEECMGVALTDVILSDGMGNGLLLPASDVPCLIWQTPMDGVKLYQYIPE